MKFPIKLTYLTRHHPDFEFLIWRTLVIYFGLVVFAWLAAVIGSRQMPIFGVKLIWDSLVLVIVGLTVYGFKTRQRWGWFLTQCVFFAHAVLLLGSLGIFLMFGVVLLPIMAVVFFVLLWLVYYWSTLSFGLVGLLFFAWLVNMFLMTWGSFKWLNQPEVKKLFAGPKSKSKPKNRRNLEELALKLVGVLLIALLVLALLLFYLYSFHPLPMVVSGPDLPVDWNQWM